jgi:pimeloyl-ACP methyl ester carboxylesterase
LNAARRTALALLAAAALFAAAPRASAQAAPQPQPIAGTDTHWIDEPVFGGRIAVYETGRGNARSILLVHGIGAGGARNFRDQIAWLRESFHVVAPDLPGFGASDRANVLYSPANYAAVLKHVAQRFLRRPFVLVGHSMGAIVSLRYAAAHPGDVERLVVISAPGVLHRFSSTSQFIAYLGLAYVPPGLDLSRDIGSLAREIIAPLARLRLDPQIILSSPQLRQALLGADPAKIAGLAAVTEDLRSVLPSVRAPTLLVWGTRDSLAPPRNGRVLAKTLPNARLQLIEGAAHAPMTEAPGRLRAMLEQFHEQGLLPAPAAAAREKRGDDRCQYERGRIFDGDYGRLTVEGCRRVTIRNSRVRELRIIDSTVAIDDSIVGGGDTGLYARNSRILVTGGRIEGDVAIRVAASRLDLAAVQVDGRRAAVRAEERGAQDGEAPQESSVVFSFSQVRSPMTGGELHDVYIVTPENPL